MAQQTGTIRGLVIDASDKETLLGANVMLEGTSRGASTQLDGTYVIRNVPVGSYVLVITYLGYDTQRIPITLAAGQDLVRNIELVWSGVTGEDVVITAQARGQISAINEQLASRQIINVISSDRIRELPDDNAATALSRISGVSIQDGDKIVIRGMQAKLNTITVNGVQLPSTDQNDRSTNLGFISSNMIDGIEVSKSILPYQDANSIGGTVNLRLRSAPEGLHMDALTQGNYNTQDRTAPNQNYQLWGSVSNRFFSDRVGLFVQANLSRSNGGNDQASAEWGPQGPGSNAGYGEATYGMNNFVFTDEVRLSDQYGGSILLDYRLKTGRVLFQSTLANSDLDLSRHQDRLELGVGRRYYRMIRDAHDKQLLVNSVQADHALGALKVDYGLSFARSKKNTALRYGDPGENFGFHDSGPASFAPFNSDTRRGLTVQDIYDLPLSATDWENAGISQFAGTRSEDFQENSTTLGLNLTLPVNVASWLDLELRSGGKLVRNTRTNDIGRTYIRVTEPGGNGTLACRGAIDWMQSKGMNPNAPLSFVDFRNYSYDRGQYFLRGAREMDHVIDTGLMDSYMRLASACWPNHEADTWRDDFEANETITAGYFMGTFDIGKRLSIMSGVRYEQFDMDYSALYVIQVQSIDGSATITNHIDPNHPNPTEAARRARQREVADSLTNVNRSYGHFFPNLQIRYSFTPWLDLRLAYTTSISRPDYIALVPNIYRAASNSGRAGNPYLKPTTAQSYDAQISLYSNKIGLFTVGAFHKKLENVFFGVTRLFSALPEESNFPRNALTQPLFNVSMDPGAQISTWMNNSNPAFVSGYEIDWQTNFWYFPKPLNSMVLNINYTRAFSKMDYDQVYFRTVRTVTPRPPLPPLITFRSVEVDTIRTARLLQQGDHIINVALGADYKGFSGRVSFRLQGDVISSVGTRPEEDTFNENVYGWDFTMRQKLPIEGLSVAFSGVNISHAPTQGYRYFRRELGEPKASQLTNVNYGARRFELAVRYTF